MVLFAFFVPLFLFTSFLTTSFTILVELNPTFLIAIKSFGL